MWQLRFYQYYWVYQGFRPNLGKFGEIIILTSLLTTFEVVIIFKVAGAVAKIGSSPKLNRQIKLTLSK